MPVIVYVVTASADSQTAIASRQQVQIDARFYKRMHLAARDQQAHDYPAFVGRFPIALAGTASPSPNQPAASTPRRGLDVLAVIAGPVVLMMIVFVGMRMWIARKSRGGWNEHFPARGERWERDSPRLAVDDEADLPDDPAAALAELRRRADHAQGQSQSPASQ
jgi:hypothetical protein